MQTNAWKGIRALESQFISSSRSDRVIVRTFSDSLGDRGSSLILLRRLLKSYKLSPIVESLGFSILILKNLTKARLFFIRGSSALRRSRLRLPSMLVLKREREKTLNFVNLARYIQERAGCFIQFRGSECSLATFAVSSREGNFILAFRISLIPATWIHLFPLCGLENTADSIPSLPRILRGKPHDLYPT